MGHRHITSCQGLGRQGRPKKRGLQDAGRCCLKVKGGSGRGRERGEGEGVDPGWL